MKALFLSIFLFLSVLCNAQIYQFKAEAIATRLYSHVKEGFEEWDEWRHTDVIITLDTGVVNVYSEMEQKYTIITSSFDSLQNIIIFDCIDTLGGRCTINIIFLAEVNAFHMYIRWNHLQVVYQMRKL